jgi:7-cyano-7-deazaguanine synthase
MLVPETCSPDEVEKAVTNMAYIASQSTERGRDGQGYALIGRDKFITNRFFDDDPAHIPILFNELRPHEFMTGSALAGLGNCRAEPTTEYLAEKHLLDQQPYTLGSWSIVHNGTISNDKDLRTDEYASKIDSAVIVELLDKLTCAQARRDCNAKDPADWILTPEKLWLIFGDMLRVIEGSYAILAVHQGFPDLMFVACNYRPLYMANDNGTMYLASTAVSFPVGLTPVPVQPYTMAMISVREGVNSSVRPMRPQLCNKHTKALVVLSGGLDSTVALAKCMLHYGEVTAIHFKYGARPADKEAEAVKAIAEHYGITCVTLPLGNPRIYSPATSKLLDPDATIAGGEAGAEFAHEWVPARNLLMLATATAYAEAHGYQIIALGNNLEEAGAYPDNEPELYERFNALLDFAIGAGKQLRVIQPVGNLMKHEIVQQGLALQAPLHLTWSCYHKGALHCGKCGPCYMRRKAFDINHAPEVIQYAPEGSAPDA